jgi:hypothetical protein
MLLALLACTWGDDYRPEPGTRPDDTDDTDDTDDACDTDAPPLWYTDADGDGYGAGAGQGACDPPAGTVDNAEDCDDADPGTHPDADEVCNDGRDDDCDRLADDLDPDLTGASTWHRDADGDGFGEADDGALRCDAAAPYVPNGTDCDDADPAVFPGAGERCDGAGGDEDCDGLVDGADPDADPGTFRSWYADADGDGWGDDDATTSACDAPAGHAAEAGDCDDGDSSVRPDAEEICANGVDDDCDGSPGECGLAGDATLSSSAALAKVMGGLGDYLAYDDALDVADLDGDGDLDLVVGGHRNAGAGIRSGAVYVLDGPLSGRTPVATAITTILGTAAEDQLGQQVLARDFDGDGTLELAVMADREVFLFATPLGGSLTEADATARLETSSGFTAVQPLRAGDIDGDGILDLVAATPSDDDQVFAWFGPVTTDTRGLVIDGTELGAALAVGDLDGDGADEIMVASTAPSTTGATLLVFAGGSSGTLHAADALATMAPGTTTAIYSTALAVADLDGDGRGDLLVGAEGEDYGADAGGAVHLFTGPLVGAFRDTDATAMRYALDTFAWFGSTVAAADLTGDGAADLVVGATDIIGGPGRVWIFAGPLAGTDTTDSALAEIVGEVTDDRAGDALAVGDMDEDGFLDLLVGSPFEDAGGDYAGAVYVMPGGGL